MSFDAWISACLPARTAAPAFDLLMILASTVGLLVLAGLGPWWIARRDRPLARAVACTMLVGLGLTLALQWLSLRPRPLVDDPLLPVPPLPSFPSGHAVLVVIAIVGLSVHHRRLAAAALPVAGLVLLSRVHLGHHHATDVLGGVVLGLGLGLGARGRHRAAPDDPWRLRWLLWPQLGLVAAISLVAYTGVFASGRVPWLRWPGMDKLLHAVLFGQLAVGLHLMLRGRSVAVGRWRWPLAVWLPMVGAGLEEGLQAASPHRTADPWDLLADLAGLLVLGGLVRRRVAPSETPPPSSR